MKNITIKIQNASQLVEQVQVVTKDGEPTIIPAQKSVNYEFVDNETGHALQHIVTKRQDDDLYLSFEDNGQEADVIIENFYAYKDSALIGLAEEGQYYYYIPDTANLNDYVTQLNNGDIEGQALGGKGFAEPWWVTGGSDVNVFPFLLGIGLLGGAVAIANHDDEGKISEMLKDFVTTSETSEANPASLLANNLSSSATEYTLPENLALTLDENTVSAMNDAQNLAVDVNPSYRIVEETLPVLESDEVVDMVSETAEKSDTDEVVVDASVDVNYAVYHDMALPVIIETETPII